MLLPFKKKDQNPSVSSKDAGPKIAIPAAINFSDFVPYYCHYSPETLITKNGELLQIIKIATNLQGLDYEGSGDESTIVREAIRHAIKECVQTDKVALWIHTVRKRRPIEYVGKFSEKFAQDLQDRWQKVHRWNYQYYNEIYVVVMHDGQSSSLTDTHYLKNVVLPKRNRDFRNGYLDAAFDELDRTVHEMMKRISENFNVTRLGLIERAPIESSVSQDAEPIFYSEPIEFLGLLLNLRSEQLPLSQIDISETLITTSLTFGFNALETKNAQGKRRFAAILTLKQYREVPAETMDRLLQLPMEFIVTQTFHFAPPGSLKEYNQQNQLFKISGDLYCIEASGITDIMASKTGRLTDFGEHQTSIMVLSDEFKQLDNEISKIQGAFAELGLITIREDLKLEECFWSQLPGNFVFIRRKDIINTIRTAGFSRLNRYPNGTAHGNHWGEAVAILPTLVGSPYFFNFHHLDNGHTVMMDFNSFGDHIGTILLNFLLVQSRKFDSRLYIFDRDQSANLLFTKLGGDYHHFPVLNSQSDYPQLRLNPFSLADNKRNRSFLLAWITLLLSSNVTLPDAQKDALKSAIDTVFTLDPSARHLNSFIEIISAEHAPLAKAFAKWHDEGHYAGIFDSGQEDLQLHHLLHAFDMTPVVKNKECAISIFSYLLHRIITEIDGTPTIIVLHEALDLLDNDFIGPRLESLMEMLRQNNAMLICTSSKPFAFIKTSIAEIVLKNSASMIVLPDDVRQNYASAEFGITDYNSEQLLKMNRQKGDFLLLQNHETIGLAANLVQLDEYHSVLANDVKTLSGVVKKFSNDSSDEH